MKFYLTLLLCSINLMLNCQSLDRFMYKRVSPNRYEVTPTFEKPSSREIRGAVVHFWDDKCFTFLLDSVCKASLPDDKWNKLLVQGKKGHISIWYLVSGQIYTIKFYLNEQYKEVLSEDDLYSLYMGIKTFKVDTSKIKVEYPKDANSEIEYVAPFVFPFPQKRDT